MMTVGLGWHHRRMAELKREKEVSSKLLYHLKMRDLEAEEQRQWDLRNVCPSCHIVKAVNKKCSMGCDD